jgi:CheY-specific phosphatase CheX
MFRFSSKKNYLLLICKRKEVINLKSEHLNTTIDAFRTIFETTIGVKPEKKELKLQEKLNVEKDYGISMEFKGDLKGVFIISFTKETALTIAEKLTGGFGSKEELDEMNKSAVIEIGGMIKGNALSELEKLDKKCEGSEVTLKQKEELFFEEKIIVLTAETEIGEIDLYLSLK